MTFLEHQSEEQKSLYSQLLNSVASFSRLFSESSEPYLAYRAAENIFCKAFDAENLSRSDASADAAKDGIGIGIKTFLKKNGASMEKVAEFNSDHALFRSLEPEEKIRKIAEMRNERLETTKRIFNLKELVYHCVVREAGKILVYETPMSPIDIDTIRDIQVSANGSTIRFFDANHEYNFNVSKSTLYRRFITENVEMTIPVRIIQDPYIEMGKLVAENGLIFADIKIQPHVFLPLYYIKDGKKEVQEKSALNQWNAKPRFNRKSNTHSPRNPNEVYIPIPAWIHQKFPNFFPDRDAPFELTLPSRDVMSAKVCQDGSKALMSNPNSSLGQWLLRDVLNLEERELLTYDKLQEIGLDTVVVYKVDNEHFDIDFTRVGSYENFLAENNEGEEDEILEEQED